MRFSGGFDRCLLVYYLVVKNKKQKTNVCWQTMAVNKRDGIEQILSSSPNSHSECGLLCFA